MSSPLFAAFLTNDPSNRILVSQSTDGTGWTGGYDTGQTTKAGPAMVFFKDRYILAFVANNSSNSIYICASGDGSHWLASKPLPETTIASPTLTVFKGRVWLSFLTKESRIGICYSDDGISWSKSFTLNQNVVNYPYHTPYAPTLTSFQDKLWIAFVIVQVMEGYDRPEVKLCSSADGTTWSNPILTGQVSTSQPRIAAFFDTLVVAATTDLYVPTIDVRTSTDGTRWSAPSPIKQETKSAVSLAVFENNLWMSFIDPRSDNQITVRSSVDGMAWSPATRIGQTSPATPALCSRALSSGIVRPIYQLVSVVYAPPGTQGGNSGSYVDYGAGSTLGTVTSSSKSFKAGNTVTASVGFAGSGAGTEFGFSTTEKDATALDVQKSKNWSIRVIGPATDGINHDYDLFYLWLNPQLRVSADTPTSFFTELQVDGPTMIIVYVYAGWLKKPETMPPGLKDTLTKAGFTDHDFAEILGTNPFQAGRPFDPNRFLPTTQSFAYLPPYSPNDKPPTFTYTQKSLLAKTTTKTAETQYSTGFSATIGIKGLFEASLTEKAVLEWTNSSSSTSSESSTQEATVTIGGPSFGFVGPPDIRVYWDTVFSSYLFRFEEGPASFTGILTDSTGNPFISEPVTLDADGNQLTTITDANGGFRFYGTTASSGELSYRETKLPVTLAPNQPIAKLTI